MRVVFHADDFGLAPAINAGILEAHERGVLASTSLIVNGSAAAEAVSLARSHPTLDVGLHLTLVEEAPVLPVDRVPSLVSDGHFWPHHTKVALRYATGRWRSREAIAELEAQWERIEAMGIRPSHVDGHQHLHLLPGVFAAVVEQARRRGVRFVRGWLGDPMVGSAGLARRAVLVAMQGVSAIAWSRVPASSRADVPRFPTLGFLQAGGTMTVDGLLELLDRLPTGTDLVEVMLHPGHRDADAERRYGHWNYRWEGDVALLTDPKLKPALAARNVTLTSFRELARG